MPTANIADEYFVFRSGSDVADRRVNTESEHCEHIVHVKNNLVVCVLCKKVLRKNV